VYLIDNPSVIGGLDDDGYSKSTEVSFFIGNITAASGGKDIGCLAASRETPVNVFWWKWKIGTQRHWRRLFRRNYIYQIMRIYNGHYAWLTAYTVSFLFF
jgi:hypothetical protein